MTHWLRKRIGASINHLSPLWKAVRFCRADAVLVEGKEIRTGEAARSLYLGNYRNFTYIFNLLFPEHKIVGTDRGVPAFAAGKWIRRYEKQVDLIVLDLEYLYCRMLERGNPGFLRVPEWVRQRLDVGERGEVFSEVLKTRSVKSDLNKIARHGLAYRITASERDFREFYNDMYLPFTRGRFGDTAVVEPEWKVLRQCRKGKLLQIVRGGEAIAAVLLHRDGDRQSDVWFGAAPGIEGGLLDGAYAAIYYHSIRYGCENGCRVIDFLGSRALLSDGVFRFKRKWGASVYEVPWPMGDILLKPTTLRGPVAAMFSRNCFIARETGGLAGKVLCGDVKVSAGYVEQAVKRYHTKGLHALDIYALKGVDPGVSPWARENAPFVRIIDLEGERNPQERFCAEPASPAAP